MNKDERVTSSLGKVMRIRIKLPSEHQVKEDRMREEGDHREIYVCEMCGKGFRSRKALGGHMRVHSQKARSDEVENEAGNNVDRACGGGDDSFEMEDERDEAGTTGKPMCPICGRDFPSDKALFGHMRCHPERSWRGIMPPVICSSSSTVSEDDVTDYGDDDDRRKDDNVNRRFNVVDLEKDLLNVGWGAKAVRGREATVKSCQNALDSIPPEQAAGVQNLMLLSRGGADEGSGLINFMQNLNFKGSEILEASRSNEMKNSQVLTADENCGMACPYNKKLKVASNKVGIAGIQDFQTESDRWRLISGTFGSNGAEQKQGDDESEAKNAMHKVRKYFTVNEMKAVPLNLHHSSPVKLHQVSMEVADSQRYRCTTCNKSFSSHQALGGHKSSHNKLRNAQGLIRNDHPLPKRYIPAQGGDYGINLHAGVSQNLGLMADSYVHPLHQCNVCFKIYPTGQALGGHKRLHCSIANSKPLLAVTPAMMITPKPGVSPSPAHDSESNAGEVLFNFDLNEPPPSEDDGDHQDQLCH